MLVAFEEYFTIMIGGESPNVLSEFAQARHRKVQGLEFFPLGKYQSLVLLEDCTF